MKKLILVLGGARSGKSTYALDYAKKNGKNVVFVATGIASDESMAKRIERHKSERPSNWTTIEASRNIAKSLKEVKTDPDIVIIDCLTTLSGNLIINISEPVDETSAFSAIKPEIVGIVEAWKSMNATFLVISNEVGLGVVPTTSLGCTYRDALGRANQSLASYATDVVLMVAGILLIVKSS